MRQADFVLMLHSHLPYVLNHGRWPHGSDWICEAALDTYLPLLGVLRELESANIASPATIGFTAVLANQLEHPTFGVEFEAYVAQRLRACDDALVAMHGTPDEASLAPLTRFWRTRIEASHALWRALDGDIVREFRRLQDAERVEITASAATHGFLPLLARDESIRLQLNLGRAEHRRLFGREPLGCWVPELAYRPRGMWSPVAGTPNEGVRRGIGEHLADSGFQYCFVDAHVARAGAPLGVYGEMVAGEPERRTDGGVDMDDTRETLNTPYRTYRITRRSALGEVAVFVRDPRSSMRVWSRGAGYPGDGAYLEFHRIRWPEGLRFWRVTARDAPLDAKEPYDPAAARRQARQHAGDFAAMLAEIAKTRATAPGSVIATPFTTELFGHWWFEGADFLADLYRSLPAHRRVRAMTAGAHVQAFSPRTSLRLTRASWGRNGDYTMWMNDRVAWTWPILWELENAFWDLARAALDQEALHPILAQAARELLLLQASDWQFIMTTGEVEDYAIRRFEEHAADTRVLLASLQRGLAGGSIDAGLARAEALQRRDDVFREILPSIAWAIEPRGGRRVRRRDGAIDHAPAGEP